MDLTHLLNDSDDNDKIPIPPPPTETRASHTPYVYKWPQTPRDADASDAPEASGSQSTGVQQEQSGPRYCLNCKEPMVVFKLRCDACKDINKERLDMTMAPPEFRFCIVCKASILGESVLCDTHREQEPLLTGHEKRILRDEGMCSRCSKNDPAPRRLQCKDCSAKGKMKTETLKRQSICTGCKKNSAPPGFDTCQECRDLSTARYKENKRRR